MKDVIELLKLKIHEAEAIVVATASGMSAASGLRFSCREVYPKHLNNCANDGSQ